MRTSVMNIFDPNADRFGDSESRQQQATDCEVERPFSSARFSLAVITVLWSFAAWAVTPQLIPAITVNTGGLSVSGLTPAATSIVFGVTREKRGYVTGYARHDYLLRSVNALGTASVNLPSVTRTSVWSVVDLQTGAYAMSTPVEFTLQRTALPAGALRAVDNAQLNTLRVKHELLEVLWVRPGAGVWKASVGDGGASDADHTVDGHISLSSVQMEAVGSSPPPPDHFLSGDTLILVDPSTMEISAIQVGR